MLTLAAEVHAYYRGALIALHYAEARRPTGRRFGSAADARWSNFAGTLTAHERMEILIRDADAEWPGAFGARTVFGMDDVGEDDAFGSKWPGFSLGNASGPFTQVDAEEIWQAPAPDVSSVSAAFEAMAASWEMELAAPDTEFADRLRTIDASQPLWLAGPRTIAQAAERFAGDRVLDWADQVTCVSTSPAQRQLAAFGAVVADARKPCRVLSAEDAARVLREMPRTDAPWRVWSRDAGAEDLAVLSQS